MNNSIARPHLSPSSSNNSQSDIIDQTLTSLSPYNSDDEETDKIVSLQNVYKNMVRNELESIEDSSTQNASTIGGIICVFICIATWVAMSELIPLLSSNYSKPYFLRYCVGSSYSVMLFTWFIVDYKNIEYSFQNISFNMILSAFILSFVYNVPAYSWYLSLNNTIAAINNTIFQSAIAMAYIFSILLLPNYKWKWIKNIAVICSMSGVTLIAFGTNGNSDDNKSNTWYGLTECLLATVCFGFLEVIIKIFGDKYFINTKNDPKYDKNKFNRIKDMLFMQGIMGIICILTLWPGVLILHYSDIESFELPTKKNDILCIIITAILDTTYAAAFMAAIALTNPVFVAVSQLMVVPVTFLIDVIFNGFSITFLAVIGTLFILIGFILMEVPIIKYIQKYKRDKEIKNEFKKQMLVNN